MPVVWQCPLLAVFSRGVRGNVRALHLLDVLLGAVAVLVFFVSVRRDFGPLRRMHISVVKLWHVWQVVSLLRSAWSLLSGADGASLSGTLVFFFSDILLYIQPPRSHTYSVKEKHGRTSQDMICVLYLQQRKVRNGRVVWKRTNKMARSEITERNDVDNRAVLLMRAETVENVTVCTPNFRECQMPVWWHENNDKVTHPQKEMCALKYMLHREFTLWNTVTKV